MKFLHSTLPLLLFTIATMQSCSSGDNPIRNNDTSNSSTTIVEQPPAIPANIVPDPSFVVAPEITSQFGPNCIMRDVIVDQNNNIWMASWQGIIMYDGKTFTNFTLKNGLHHHRIFSLLEDSKGILWFGTLGAGVYKYDGYIFTNLSTNNGMIHNNVLDIFEDNGGNIWFATDSGVSVYNGKTFKNYPESDYFKGNSQAISQDRNGNMWIGTSYGLYILAGESIREVSTEHETPYSNVRDLYADHIGDILIAAARGLYRANTAPGSKKEITLINDKFTGYVCEDNSGNMLITSDGITRFDGKNYEIIVKDVSNLGIFGALEDAKGTIWYGAMDGLHSVKDGKDVSYKKQK